ncbi:MAG: hypothetical protein OEY06_12395 [Gammaproteobacteria bacterium]|nr:hypothetical protein [Gammaproteobacteria bacterium]
MMGWWAWTNLPVTLGLSGNRKIKMEHINGITTNFDRGAYLSLLWQF